MRTGHRNVEASSRRADHSLLGLLGLVVWLAAACGPTPTTASSPVTLTEPSAQVTPQQVSAEQMTEAVTVRMRFGLRADEAWIRAVAADPAARVGIDEFGIPLTPPELADLMSRRWDEELLQRVREYGLLFPKDFAGVYLDLQGTGVIVEFKNQVTRHRTALLNFAADSSRVDVRKVDWSLQDLEGFMDTVEADRAWFDTIGVRFVQVDHRVNENFVHVDFIGPREEAASVIEAHFGNPSWLRAEWIGPPPWPGPRANLVIKITDSRGRPVPNIRCDVTTDNQMVGDEFGDSLIGTGPAGICELKNVPAVRYLVRLHALVDNDHYDPNPVKEFGVLLTPAGKVVDVTIPVQ